MSEFTKTVVLKTDRKMDPDKLPPMHPDATLTEEERRAEIAYLNEMEDIVGAIYWTMFHGHVGARFHAFMEWNGVMSKHLDMVRQLVAVGIDATHMNVHSNENIPLEDHHFEYLQEKIECIFNGAIKVTRADAHSKDAADGNA